MRPVRGEYTGVSWRIIMDERFLRTRMVIGDEGQETLMRASVAVFGAGGVGGAVIEALARSGIGRLDIIDGDSFSRSNLNRQILAVEPVLGKSKAQVAKERIFAINPQAQVTAWNLFYLPENAGAIDFTIYDYVVDAIDTVAGKLTIIEQAKQAGVPVISSMGTGNKLDPSAFEITDIRKTSVCPLARVMRQELKKRGITGVKVLYSKEEPRRPIELGGTESKGTAGRPVPGSMPFVPPVAGYLIAAEVVRDLLKEEEKRNG